jgi:hypothetical protein
MLALMSEMTPSSQSGLSPIVPGGSALEGTVRHLVQEVFPDLDSDVVTRVLGLTSSETDG